MASMRLPVWHQSPSSPPASSSLLSALWPLSPWPQLGAEQESSLAGGQSSSSRHGGRGQRRPEAEHRLRGGHGRHGAEDGASPGHRQNLRRRGRRGHGAEAGGEVGLGGAAEQLSGAGAAAEVAQVHGLAGGGGQARLPAAADTRGEAAARGVPGHAPALARHAPGRGGAAAAGESHPRAGAVPQGAQLEHREHPLHGESEAGAGGRPQVLRGLGAQEPAEDEGGLRLVTQPHQGHQCPLQRMSQL